MRATIAVLVLSLVPQVLAGQAARPAASAAPATPIRLTIDDAVRRALESGDEVRLARAALRQADGQITQAWAAALPEIRTSLTYQRTFASVFSSGSSSSGPTIPPFEPDSTAPLSDRIRYLEDEYPNMLGRGIGSLFSDLPFGRKNTYIAAITVNQTLFQGGKVGAGLRGARAFRRAAEAQIEETERDVSYRVRQAYLGAVYAERLLGIAEASQASTNEHLRRVELNHRVGTSADYDLLRAQVEAANQEPIVIAARNGAETAMLELHRLVNIPVEQPLELATSIPTSSDSLPEVDLAAVQAAQADRASVVAAEAGVQVWREAVRVYRADRYPALRFAMTYGGQAYPSGNIPAYSDFRRDWNASLSLSMPLFDGGRTRGQVQQAQAELMRAETQLQQTRETVSIDVEQARSELLRARALVVARRQTVTQAGRAHELASVRFANGISPSIEVSDARLALQQARVNEAQATRDYLLAISGLERALGRPVPLLAPGRRVASGGGDQ